MKKTIAIVNQKGGVGKTTTAVNLAAALAAKNKRVLLIDLDPQGNASSGVGVDKNSLEANVADVFLGVFSLPSIIINSKYPSLWIAPSNSDLIGLEFSLFNLENKEHLLKEQIARVANQFDHIILDCPPSLSILTVNALVAADALLVPLQCEYYALEGISALIKSLDIVQESINPALDLEGVVLTMYDARTNLSREVAAEAKQFFGDKLYNTYIPRNVKLSECPSYGLPILAYDPLCSGSKAYIDLANEFIERTTKVPLQSVQMSVQEEGNSLHSTLVANS